jgi:hypothetical protein
VNEGLPGEMVASVYKYLRICDLCKELGIFACVRIFAAKQERQAKTDACLVLLGPLARGNPKRGNGLSAMYWWVAREGSVFCAAAPSNALSLI